MDRNTFINEVKDILEIEDDELIAESEIHLTSLSTLSMMAFIYENFDRQVKASELQKISQLKDLMNLIGYDNLA
jgi:acyl carrier protein